MKKYEGRVIFVSVGVPQNQTPEKQRDYTRRRNDSAASWCSTRFKGITAYKATHTSYVSSSARRERWSIPVRCHQDLDAAISKAFSYVGANGKRSGPDLMDRFSWNRGLDVTDNHIDDHAQRPD